MPQELLLQQVVPAQKVQNEADPGQAAPDFHAYVRHVERDSVLAARASNKVRDLISKEQWQEFQLVEACSYIPLAAIHFDPQPMLRLGKCGCTARLRKQRTRKLKL